MDICSFLYYKRGKRGEHLSRDNNELPPSSLGMVNWHLREREKKHLETSKTINNQSDGAQFSRPYRPLVQFGPCFMAPTTVPIVNYRFFILRVLLAFLAFVVCINLSL
jgi:hypothetical protein